MEPFLHSPSRVTKRVLLAVAITAAAGAARAADVPLSLEAAVQASLTRARSLEALNAAAQGARERAVAAGQRPDPVLRFSLDNVPADGPNRFSTTSDFMTMRSIAWMQSLPAADKRRARSARFEREADTALSARAQRVAQLQVEVAQAWLERHMQEQRVQVLQAQINEAQVLVRTTQAALGAGSGSATDVLSAREALAQLEQSQIGVFAARANARLTLARFTGGAPDQPLADAPPFRRRADAGDALDQLPDIALLRAREAVAQADVELARQELRPDWSVELMFSQRGSRFSNMVSVGLSVPLQWDREQRQHRELAARIARVNELEAEREERMRERTLQLQRWQLDWRAGLERLQFLNTQRLPLVQQRLETSLAAYRGGREGLNPVLLARREALNLTMERLVLERDTAGLWAQLEYVLPHQPNGAKP